MEQNLKKTMEETLKVSDEKKHHADKSIVRKSNNKDKKNQ
jgi:hypothetical protein